MKNVILSLVVLAASMSAHATLSDCKQNEAQFIGTIVDIQRDVQDQNMVFCSYRVQFADYSPSGICPLSQAVASEARFDAESCKGLVEGAEVSGYMVETKDGHVYIE